MSQTFQNKILEDLTFLNKNLVYRKNSKKLDELKQYDNKIKSKRLSRPKLRKGRVKRLKRSDTMKNVPLSVEKTSPPFSPPYSSFSDGDKFRIEQNLMNQMEDDESAYRKKQLMNPKLGNILLSFDVDEKNNLYIQSSLNKINDSGDIWRNNFFDSEKVISPIPLLSSPLSDLSDMVQIQKELKKQESSHLFKKKRKPVQSSQVDFDTFKVN